MCLQGQQRLCTVGWTDVRHPDNTLRTFGPRNQKVFHEYKDFMQSAYAHKKGRPALSKSSLRGRPTKKHQPLEVSQRREITLDNPTFLAALEHERALQDAAELA